MIDHRGRIIDYIRISVTDRCNLRCVYCMPKDGIPLVAKEEILTYEEIAHLCRVFAKKGIRHVKLTGGEPLVRKDLPRLIRLIREIPEIEQITLTTNGTLLAEQMQELVDAGIDGINISLDTLDEKRYEEITGSNQLAQALQGIKTALKYKEIPVKVNCVPMNMGKADVIAMASLAKDHPVKVRFIEMMPIGLGKQYSSHNQEQIETWLEEAFGVLKPVQKHMGNGPAVYYSLPDFKGHIGFISAISHGFCQSCNRIRLTSQGFLKTCLQYEKGFDLKQMLRKGASDKELADVIKKAIDEKPEGHHFCEKEQTKDDETHSMAQIGG